jgi:hypothetical protein
MRTRDSFAASISPAPSEIQVIATGRAQALVEAMVKVMGWSLRDASESIFNRIAGCFNSKRVSGYLILSVSSQTGCI